MTLQGIDSGFVLEYQARKGAADQAEIKVDLASAGEWYGGGEPLLPMPEIPWCPRNVSN